MTHDTMPAIRPVLHRGSPVRSNKLHADATDGVPEGTVGTVVGFPTERYCEPHGVWVTWLRDGEPTTRLVYTDEIDLDITEPTGQVHMAWWISNVPRDQIPHVFEFNGHDNPIAAVSRGAQQVLRAAGVSVDPDVIEGLRAACLRIMEIREMKGIAWGTFFDAHQNDSLDPKVLEEKVIDLMLNDDVTAKKGIYPYLLTHDQKHLNIRRFTASQKREAYERQKGICPTCSKGFDIDEMEGDHFTPWHLGGKTSADNCQMLCRDCNRKKAGR